MAFTKDRVKQVGINRFEFSGKVIKKDLKFSSKTGNMYGSITVEIPGKEEKWKTNMFVKFFSELAEKAEAEINVGDNQSFYGYVKNGSYVAQTGEKKYTTDFVAMGFEKAEEVAKTEFVKGNDEKEKDDIPF